jgi:putative endonuclease
MKYFVYIVRCVDNYLYTGITWNLQKRIKEHNTGIRTILRNSQMPAKLVYWEKFDTKISAAKRVKEIEGWRRSKKEDLISSLH